MTVAAPVNTNWDTFVAQMVIMNMAFNFYLHYDSDFLTSMNAATEFFNDAWAVMPSTYPFIVE